MKRHHVLPFGAELLPAGGTRFRLWAPQAALVTVIAATPQGTQLQADLHRHDTGWHELEMAGVGTGSLYRYRVENELDVPDPGSRFNPRGVHGPSEVIDPGAFDWQDDQWRGRPWHEAVLYELHVGTFTEQGTFAAIIPRLEELVALGITCLELMPIATFPGQRGWGYDGVLPFAPQPTYGRPEDLKRLVQAAHAVGLSVLLDVVYNHFGPDGNFLHRYAPAFFNHRHHTPWGAAINFEGAAGRNVREFFIHNALYWLDEYHLDGLRLDAVHAIRDDSQVHFVDQLATALANGPARERQVHLVLENHLNQASRLRGSALKDASRPQLSKAQWNDDFHHALHVLVTGETDGYYVDYAAAPVAQAARILAEGFAYQGEPSVFGGNQPRGEISRHLPPTAFINFLQNHDQVGNRALGERIAQLADPGELKAALALLLLSPQPPLLFMGEEYAAPEPFLYFCEYQGDLAAAITQGRRAEFGRFRGFDSPAALERIPDPNSPDTFAKSRLHWEKRDEPPHREWLEFTRRLLRIRQECVVPLIPSIVADKSTFATGQRTLSVRWPLADGRSLSLRANFAATQVAAPMLQGALLYAVQDVSAAAESMGPWEVQLWLS